MLDFYEFLGRGITAARTGRTTEAIRYLGVAQEISPRNPRVWLWLASVAKSKPQKKRCLQNALKLDPNQPMATILLQRLEKPAGENPQHAPILSTFTCPQCGGKQYFDPDRMGLVCQFCGSLEPLLPQDPPEESQNRQHAAGNWAALESRASCKACGAQLSVPADLSTLACPFCDTENIQIQHAGVELVRPSQVGLFSIDVDEARAALMEWSRGKLPLASSPPEALRPIYLPFWRFNTRVRIRCALARRIEPEEFSNYDRVVADHSDWPTNPNGWYERDFVDHLFYGGHSLSDKEIERILPFDLEKLVPYQPQILTGWQAELYQISLEDAAITTLKRMRDAAFAGAARRMLFIEPSDLLQSDISINSESDLVLLPVWIYRYSLKGESVHVLVNGQTAEVQGKKPGNGIFGLLR